MFLQFNKSNYKLCRTQIENEWNYSLKKENRLMPRFLVFCYQTPLPVLPTYWRLSPPCPTSSVLSSSCFIIMRLSTHLPNIFIVCLEWKQQVYTYIRIESSLLTQLLHCTSTGVMSKTKVIEISNSSFMLNSWVNIGERHSFVQSSMSE